MVSWKHAGYDRLLFPIYMSLDFFLAWRLGSSQGMIDCFLINLSLDRRVSLDIWRHLFGCCCVQGLSLDGWHNVMTSLLFFVLTLQVTGQWFRIFSFILPGTFWDMWFSCSCKIVDLLSLRRKRLVIFKRRFCGLGVAAKKSLLRRVFLCFCSSVYVLIVWFFLLVMQGEVVGWLVRVFHIFNRLSYNF